MKISELKPNMKNLTIEAKVEEVSQAKEYSRMGSPGKVGQAIISDETGSITLTLWNEQTEMLAEGDKIVITGAKTSAWQGKTQLSTSFAGEIKKI
jgi:replication factor A1